MTIQTARSRGMSLGWSAVLRAVRLLIFGLIGWLLFVSANESAWRAVSLAAVLALAALVGITWYLSRALADRRWRAALDIYAEQEQAKRTHTHLRRNFHARPQSQNR
jgi:fatty-acid desaturase